MKRRFIVAVSGLDQADQNKFSEFIRENGLGWWHWIGDFWLLTSKSEAVSVTQIRDHIKNFKEQQTVHCLRD
jgi:hypothetical protein